MDYDVSPNNIRLKSSHEVSKDDFERELATMGCLIRVKIMVAY